MGNYLCHNEISLANNQWKTYKRTEIKVNSTNFKQLPQYMKDQNCGPITTALDSAGGNSLRYYEQNIQIEY